MITRPYQPEDAAAVAELSNVIEVHAGGHAELTPSMLAEHLAARTQDAQADTRLVFHADGTLVGYALVGVPQGARSVNLRGGVHPQWRGQGLGRQLLRWQLDRAAELHAAAEPQQEWEAHVGVLVGDEDALRLYRRCGLVPARYWLEMIAPTASATAGPMPAGLRVVRYTPELEQALHQAHMDAFAEHWGFSYRTLEQWARLSVRSERFLPELTLIAFDGEEVAGYVMCYRSAEPDRLYVGQVGVRKPWRRRGIAAALLGQVLAAAAQAGMTRAALGVDADSPTGAVGVYERIGFAVESRAVTYSMQLPPVA